MVRAVISPSTGPHPAFRAFVVIVGALAAVFGIGCEADREPIVLSGPAQGTSYRVTITEPPAELDADRARAAMRDVIDVVDRRMSTWRDDSEVSRFNAGPANEWVSVSPQLAGLVRHALRIGRETEGAFDVTIAPVLQIWGFGAGADRPERLPSRDELDAAREDTGIGLVDVRMEPPALRKKRAGTRLDLAGLAQGYTVDRMAERLDELGAKRYLVELGGELFARGRKSEDDAWRIGVEKPQAGVRAVERVVELADAGMTTSGDYRDFFEIDGRRFSHTIDPRTGRPVAHDLRAVTVIAEDAITADAMATALLVMGPDNGLRYADAHDIAALFVSGGNEAGYTESNSQAFEPYLQDKESQ